MNNLILPLSALCELTMQLYDFAINNGVDLASTVNITIDEDKADIYIISPNLANEKTSLKPPFNFNTKLSN